MFRIGGWGGGGTCIVHVVKMYHAYGSTFLLLNMWGFKETWFIVKSFTKLVNLMDPGSEFWAYGCI